MKIKIKSPKDFWSGLMFMAFGLFFVVWSLGAPAWFNGFLGHIGLPGITGYQLGSAVRMGPGYFPTMLGGLLTILGAVVLSQGLMAAGNGEEGALELPFNRYDFLLAVAIYVVVGLLAKWASSAHLEALAWLSRLGLSPSDLAILVGTLAVSLLTVRYRPKLMPLVLISAGCVAYGYLMKPLGLVLATLALVFISAAGGHEFKWKEVTVLFVVLVIFSVIVFVKGLTLPFPICPQFVDNCPIK
ncbi:MAG: tripartite tricarboxylate transporter TctB family protein [Betaproteobacteria bacterium]|nr:tripartite tricarboxylate transporter TctB family protein [Betaproteobacteria bacterium]